MMTVKTKRWMTVALPAAALVSSGLFYAQRASTVVSPNLTLGLVDSVFDNDGRLPMIETTVQTFRADGSRARESVQSHMGTTGVGSTLVREVLDTQTGQEVRMIPMGEAKVTLPMRSDVLAHSTRLHHDCTERYAGWEVLESEGPVLLREMVRTETYRKFLDSIDRQIEHTVAPGLGCFQVGKVIRNGSGVIVKQRQIVSVEGGGRSDLFAVPDHFRECDTREELAAAVNQKVGYEVWPLDPKKNGAAP